MKALKKLIAPTTVILASILNAGNAVANSQDLIAITVPATAYEPVSEIYADMVVLSNGAWIFSGNNTGFVVFNCPLSINVYKCIGSANKKIVHLHYSN